MGRDDMADSFKIIQSSLETVSHALEKINRKQDEHGSMLADVRIEQARSFEQKKALIKSFDQHVEDDRTIMHEVKNRIIPLENERWKNRGIAATIAAMFVLAKEFIFRST